jgi:transposase, IS30 family
MPKAYSQVSLEERCEIARRLGEGQSLRQIAAALDRPASTISREVARNSGRKAGYRPAYADQQTKARRWSGSKLIRKPELGAAVLDGLSKGWSPEQVAGRLKREDNKTVVSHETIYRFIYAELIRTKNYDWRLYLPRAKSKRGYRGRKGGSPASFIKGRVPLDERPDEAADRATSGHWEADLMAFSKYRQSLLALHERSSRLILMTRPPSKHAAGIAAMLYDLLQSMPEQMRRTLTFDNGTEFAQHYLLHDLGLKTFFCDPHSPWQKGGVENAIGRMRRFMPRKTDLENLSKLDLKIFVDAYNTTPRKCLDFRTPAEVFLAQLLHFKCESTYPLSRGRRGESAYNASITALAISAVPLRPPNSIGLMPSA